MDFGVIWVDIGTKRAVWNVLAPLKRSSSWRNSECYPFRPSDFEVRISVLIQILNRSSYLPRRYWQDQNCSCCSLDVSALLTTQGQQFSSVRIRSSLKPEAENCHAQRQKRVGHSLSCLGIPRWDETAGNKERQGENDKEIEKEKAENTRKTATILWLSLRAIFNYKTGHFSRC